MLFIGNEVLVARQRMARSSNLWKQWRRNVMLHHVELYVSDLERSRAFYGVLLGALGYTVYQEWSEGISYLMGETYIVLVQAEERHLDPPYHRCRVGLNHLAFHGGSRAAVDRLTATMVANGATLLYADRHPHAGGPDYYAAFFEDPDRIKLELVASD